MTVRGEDELEVLNALEILRTQTEQKLLSARGFELKDGKAIRGDLVLLPAQAVGQSRGEIQAEKAEYYISHVIPGLLCDSLSVPGVTLEPKNKEKVASAARKLSGKQQKQPVARPAKYHHNGRQEALLAAIAAMAPDEEFTSLSLSKQVNMPREYVGPYLSVFKQQGAIKQVGRKLHNGKHVNVYLRGDNTQAAGSNAQKAESNLEAALIEFTGREFLARDLAAKLNISQRHAQIKLRTLIAAKRINRLPREHASHPRRYVIATQRVS